MKHRLKVALESLGLLHVALRVQEAYWSLRSRRISLRHGSVETGDDLPLPPADLMVLVGGATHAAAFVHGGRVIAEVIESLVAEAGGDLAQARILDFGCGCGRVTRRWHGLRGTVCGTDYNARLIAWCRANLPFATFEVNDASPPLPFEDGRFDVAYAFSVFTHFPERLQRQWLAEMARVVRPGGLFIPTVLPASSSVILTPAERVEYDAGRLVVRYDSVAGTNLCAAFHPPG